MSIPDPISPVFELSLYVLDEIWIDVTIEYMDPQEMRHSRQTKIKKSHLERIRTNLIDAFCIYQKSISGTHQQMDNALPDLIIATSAAFKDLMTSLDEIAIAQERQPPTDIPYHRVGSFFESIIATYGKYRGARIEVYSNITFLPFDLLYSRTFASNEDLKGFLGRIFLFVYWSSKPEVGSSGSGSNEMTIRRGGRMKLFQHVGLDGLHGRQISEDERKQLRSRSDKLGLTFADYEVDSNVRMKAYWSAEADLSQICHFTCHHDTGRSRLQLSDTYVFYPNILRDLDPPFPKPLVFLNTCEGAGKGVNDVDSLINEFYPDHSKGLVSTFARVRLRYAVDFADTFYKNLSLPQQGVLDALANTKEELMAKNSQVAAVYLIYGLFCVQPNLMLEGEELPSNGLEPTLVG